MEATGKAIAKAKRDAWAKIFGDGGVYYDAHGEEATAVYLFELWRHRLRDSYDTGFEEGKHEALASLLDDQVASRIAALAKANQKGFNRGFREGMERYAWWRDGVQYVGSCGTTLKKALEEFGEA